MAEVIRFPQHRHFELGGSTRHRCILALEFVSKTIRSGDVTPTEMLIMYGTRNGDETIWSYLNLGFDPKLLTVAVCRILNDVEERDDGRTRDENGRDPDIPA